MRVRCAVWVLWLATSAVCLACSCTEIPSVRDAWSAADLVFTGTLVEGQGSSQEQHAVVRVLVSFKGARVGAEVSVVQDQAASCRRTLAAGEVYLFYLPAPGRDGARRIEPCGRTRIAAQAESDLRFLRGLPDSARLSHIAGVITSWEGFADGRPDASTPVSGVTVNVSDGSKTWSAVTDEQGIYDIMGVPAGTYVVRPEPTHAGAPYPRSERVHLDAADSAASADFTFYASNRVSGRVTGPDGKPMADVCLVLEPVQPGPVTTSACTNTDGRYMIERIPTGSYLLVANYDGRPTPSSPFERLYAPGVTAADQARVIAVGYADEIRDVDMRIAAFVPLVEVRGRVRYQDGEPAGTAHIEYLWDGGTPFSFRPDMDGSFRLHALAGLPGMMRAEVTEYPRGRFPCQAPRAVSARWSDSVSIDASRNVDGVLITLPFRLCGGKRSR